jgi:putative solute:sodium symporter small subunit
MFVARTRGKEQRAELEETSAARPSDVRLSSDQPSATGRGVRHAGACRERRRIGGLNPMESKDDAYWNDTRRLMFIHLGVWIFFGYVVHMFVNVLNNITIIGFPFGFYMAAQGSLIAFVVMLFLFARQQDAIDRKHGVAEDD